MRAEASNETSRSEGTSKSESKSETDSHRAEKSSDDASKAADEARKAADEARKAADEANRATTQEARRSASQRAEQATRNASAASTKAQAAAQSAEQAARSASQSAGSGPADARAVQVANKAAAAAREAAKAASQSTSDATKTLNTLRTPGTADSFSASSTPATAAATKVQTPPLPPAAQATVDQARQAQTNAQAATAASTRAELNVQQAQAQLLRAQQAATLARNAQDKGVQGYDPTGQRNGQLRQAATTSLENLSAARQTLATAQAEASAAATKAREAAGTAEQAAQKVDQLARQQPDAAAALTSVAADTRKAAALATSGATRAAEAAKPQPVATVSFDVMYAKQNNGGQHDVVFDGALIGSGGKVYPPGTDAGQIAGVLPNNGTPATGERIYYVNGIQNTASFQSQSIQNIANATGAEVVGLHNSTEGMGLDLQQCMLDKLPTFANTNAATRALAVQIVTDIQANRPIHLMAHSQGGLVTSGALTLAKEYLETIKPGTKAQADDILKNIKVETFGSAASTWPHGPQYTHYINEDDTVPMLTGLGRQGNPERQQNAGGDRAEIHFIRDDPRTPNPLLWSPETNLGAMIPAHDFNDGYLSHREPWQAGHADSADLSGPSPVAVRDEATNKLTGYNYYVLDTAAPAMQAARHLRDGVEQTWQVIGSVTSELGSGINDAGHQLAQGLSDASQAVGQGLSDASQAVGQQLNEASQAVGRGLSNVGNLFNPARW